MNKNVLFFKELIKYRWLIQQLVLRDNKVKYKQSVLGYLWSLLNPLLMMIVMTAVFSHIFRFDIPNFPIYFLCGNIMFSFFQESTTLALSSIIANAGLLKKVYIPKYTIPLSRVLSSFLNCVYSLSALFIILLLSKTPLSVFFFLIPFPFLYLFVFSLGISLILSILATLFRDTLHLYSVLTVVWMYLTPIFYPIEAVPHNIQVLIRYNPLYHFVTMLREIILYGQIPTLQSHVICVAYAILSISVGTLIFKENQGKLLLYV